MRDFSRPAVRFHGVAEAVAADAGVRMYLAVLPDLATGAHENMRMQHGSLADPRIVLYDRVSADHAAVADAGMRPDHAIGPEVDPFADRGVRVHHRRRM